MTWTGNRGSRQCLWVQFSLRHLPWDAPIFFYLLIGTQKYSIYAKNEKIFLFMSIVHTTKILVFNDLARWSWKRFGELFKDCCTENLFHYNPAEEAQILTKFGVKVV